MEFNEYMVRRKKGPKEMALSTLYFFAAAIISFASMTFLMRILGSLSLIVAIGAFYGAIVLTRRLNKEFEYICVEDSIDIDVIFNASSRKRLISFSIKKAEILASVNDINYNSQINGQFDKIIDATSGTDGKDVYFVILEQDGKTLIMFEPPRQFLEELKKYAPSKVMIKN